MTKKLIFYSYIKSEKKVKVKNDNLLGKYFHSCVKIKKSIRRRVTFKHITHFIICY